MGGALTSAAVRVIIVINKAMGQLTNLDDFQIIGHSEGGAK